MASETRTDAEAVDVADLLARTSRLIAGAFRRDGERLPDDRRPRFSIPCRPAHDDDTALTDGIKALAAERDAALSALAEARAERDRLRETNGLKPHGEAIAFRYTNWRGETANRTGLPAFIFWGASEWHPEPQWLMRALDVDKGEPRDFALKDCDFAALRSATPAKEAEHG